MVEYHRNQYTTPAARKARLPGPAVTKDERRQIETVCRFWHISLAEAVRCSAYCAGILDDESINGLANLALVEHLQKHRTLLPPGKTFAWTQGR